MSPVVFHHLPRNKKLLTKVLFPPQIYKMYSFRQLIEERIANDRVFKEKVNEIKRMVALNKISQEQADTIYFQALDESIKRARSRG